jgi:hypothetical protein
VGAERTCQRKEQQRPFQFALADPGIPSGAGAAPTLDGLKLCARVSSACRRSARFSSTDRRRRARGRVSVRAAPRRRPAHAAAPVRAGRRLAPPRDWTVVRLRPFRPSGFVLHAERAGDELLVHNLRDGGGGVTLAWGTTRLAVDDLGGWTGALDRAAVIGCGAVGSPPRVFCSAAASPSASTPGDLLRDRLRPDRRPRPAGSEGPRGLRRARDLQLHGPRRSALLGDEELMPAEGPGDVPAPAARDRLHHLVARRPHMFPAATASCSAARSSAPPGAASTAG